VKKVLAALLMFAFVLQVMQLNTSLANPYSQIPAVGILLPESSMAGCYSNDSVPVKIGVLLKNSSLSEDYSPRVSYSLDNTENVSLTNFKKGDHWAKAYPLISTVSYTASTTFYGLSEGNHTLNAYLFAPTGEVLSSEIIFTVDSNYKKPELTLISPININYTTSQVKLVFATTYEIKSAKYLLDYHLHPSARYIKINGNVTLANLTDGIHKIMLFVDCYDKYGNGRSLFQGTRFNVSINENTSEIQNNTPIEDPLINPAVATTSIVATIILCIIFGYLIRKKKPLNNNQIISR
jgi:hypothetical protein